MTTNDDLAAWIVGQLDREIAAALARIEGLERARAIAIAAVEDQGARTASSAAFTHSRQSLK